MDHMDQNLVHVDFAESTINPTFSNFDVFSKNIDENMKFSYIYKINQH
jgi:hypothetical protein